MYLLRDIKPDMPLSDLKDRLYLIYNAGYRKGLKARTEDKNEPELPLHPKSE